MVTTLWPGSQVLDVQAGDVPGEVFQVEVFRRWMSASSSTLTEKGTSMTDSVRRVAVTTTSSRRWISDTLGLLSRAGVALRGTPTPHPARSSSGKIRKTLTSLLSMLWISSWMASAGGDLVNYVLLANFQFTKENSSAFLLICHRFETGP